MERKEGEKKKAAMGMKLCCENPISTNIDVQVSPLGIPETGRGKKE